MNYKVFDKNMRFTDYCQHVSKYLVIIYDYFPDQAIKIVEQGKDFIKYYYENEESIYSCTLDLGYSCG